MAVTIQIRRDQASDWTAANPILAEGEFGLELDTDKRKRGDGVTAWTALAYFDENGGPGGVLPVGTEGQTLRWEDGSTSWEATSDLVVDDAGNVGIGTAAPDQKLSVAGDVTAGEVSLYVSNASGPELRVGCIGDTNVGVPAWTGSSVIESFGGDLVLGAYNPDNIVFTTAFRAEAMRIDASGNVGIGSVTPAYPLSVANTIQLFNNTSGSTINDGFVQQIVGLDVNIINREAGFIRTFTNNLERMRIDSAGNVLVGSTGNSAGTEARMFVQGGGVQSALTAYAARTGGAATPIAEFFSNQNGVNTIAARIGADGVYTDVSDYRLKDTFGPVTGALDRVNAVPVHLASFKSLPEEQCAMVLAHEVSAQFPCAVTGEKDGEEMQMVAYRKLIPDLMAAIQELTARLEALENA